MFNKFSITSNQVGRFGDVTIITEAVRNSKASGLGHLHRQF